MTECLQSHTLALAFTHSIHTRILTRTRSRLLRWSEVAADGPDVEMAQSREHATQPLVYETRMDADSTVQSYKV